MMLQIRVRHTLVIHVFQYLWRGMTSPCTARFPVRLCLWALRGLHSRGSQSACFPSLKERDLAVHTSKDLGCLRSLSILVSELEEVTHVFCLEKSLMPGITEHLHYVAPLIKLTVLTYVGLF